MVDQTVPTTQFHEYQKPEAQPHSEQTTSGLSDMLSKLGLGALPVGRIADAVKNSSLGSSLNNVNLDSLKNMDWKGSATKARDYARANPAKVLGGLAALVIGAGLMRQRSTARWPFRCDVNESARAERPWHFFFQSRPVIIGRSTPRSRATSIASS
jgi:hypothetical protein